MIQPARLTPYLLATFALVAWGLVPTDRASGMSSRVREALRNDLPNGADYERIERGYYEQLLDVGRQPVSLTAADPGGAGGHAEPSIDHGQLTLLVADVREFVLKPNLVRDPPNRIPWSTNSHGMRDREYPTTKPAGTFRIALAGDSIAAGWGVGDDEGFEPRLEATLHGRSEAAGGPNVEILNFAVPGHGPGQRWSHFSMTGWGFAPDVVLYEATLADLGWDERRLRGQLAKGIGRDAPVYRDTLDAASVKVKPGLEPEVYKGVLKPLKWELLAGVYRAAVAECRSRGVPVVWVLIPRVGKPVDPAERRRLVALARETGFSAVVDLCDVYDGFDPSALAVSPNDFHPNAEGHTRVARALDAAFADLPAFAPLGRWRNPSPRGPEPAGRTSGEGGGTDPR